MIKYISVSKISRNERGFSPFLYCNNSLLIKEAWARVTRLSRSREEPPNRSRSFCRHGNVISKRVVWAESLQELYDDDYDCKVMDGLANGCAVVCERSAAQWTV